MIEKNYTMFSQSFSEILKYEKSFVQACLGNFIELKNLSKAKEFASCLQKSIDSFEKASVKLDEEKILMNSSDDELKRRMKCFIRNQRNETNILNSYEFAIGGQSSEFSCARVDSVYRPSFGQSHVKMREVTNHRGPQNILEQDVEVMPSTAMTQRINNIAQHIKFPSDSTMAVPEAPVSKALYARVKELEERVMLLEGVSPELFNYYNDRHDDDNDDSFGL